MSPVENAALRYVAPSRPRARTRTRMEPGIGSWLAAAAIRPTTMEADKGTLCPRMRADTWYSLAFSKSVAGTPIRAATRNNGHRSGPRSEGRFRAATTVAATKIARATGRSSLSRRARTRSRLVAHPMNRATSRPPTRRAFLVRDSLTLSADLDPRAVDRGSWSLHGGGIDFVPRLALAYHKICQQTDADHLECGEQDQERARGHVEALEAEVVHELDQPGQ